MNHLMNLFVRSQFSSVNKLIRSELSKRQGKGCQSIQPWTTNVRQSLELKSFKQSSYRLSIIHF